ncbi:MAG: histidine phosphatase family protein [Planctomycetota bacterium]
MPPPSRHPGFRGGTRLWLLRHAEVDPAWQGRAYGDLDVPLSAEGEETTLAVGRAFEGASVERVLASPLARAHRLGAEVARAAGAPLETFDGLREIFRGDWQGRVTAELERDDPEGVRAFYADPWGYRGHGGECDEEILARAWPAVERAASAARESDGFGDAPRTVVLATHYNVIRVLATHMLGLDPARSFAFRVDTGRCTLFIDEPEGWVLRTSNAASPRAAEAPA